MATEVNTISTEKEANGTHQGTHPNQHQDFSELTAGQYAPAWGGALQPGVCKPFEHRKLANPGPLGLSAFALTTFVLSACNMHTRGVNAGDIVVSLAFGYGGLVQLLAGMWEMACGNTFGATALGSFGGFWISYGIILTPNWMLTAASGPYDGNPANVLGFFLTGWFVFTTVLLLCTLKSSLAFFLLFFFLDLAFLLLACQQYALDLGNATAALALQKAGGLFGFLAAFFAWYNALSGLQDSSNSFFQVPLIHFPWSEKGMERRASKTERLQA